jgi:2-deoxy-D-gluconate 3-dehydrogenase
LQPEREDPREHGRPARVGVGVAAKASLQTGETPVLPALGNFRRCALFDVQDKVVVVTGGSRGLGLAISRGFAECGARVAVIARTPPPKDGPQLHFFKADLARAQARTGLVAKVAQKMGGLDVLIHCAGQVHRQAAVDFSPKMWEEIFQLHVHAAMDLSQQAARIMLPRDAGKIILVSSILGFQGGVMVPAYSAAKHAINGLVKALCNEWAPHHINVNAVAPGYFQTELALPLLNDPHRGPAIRARIPAGRPGEPEELVGTVVFLASAASNYVHGHTLVVDGGWLAR